jgi:hypothetical protein
MSRDETQIAIVRQHLQRHRRITGLDAVYNYKIYRLSSIISRLRRRRMRIKTYMKWNKEKTSRFAEYQLIH